MAVDPDWVDDIAQEAFLIAYREWDSFDQSRDFGKWLRGIAGNLIRNEIRKDARRQRILHTGLTEILLRRSAGSKELLQVRQVLDTVSYKNQTLPTSDQV